MRYAHSRGAVMVAAAGNTGRKYLRRVAYPARASDVIAVGATTRHGCRSDYSSFGADLDVSRPAAAWTPARADARRGCSADPGRSGDWIFQQTFSGRSVRRFGLPGGYEGTSMASPHVAAIAALVIATAQARRRPDARGGPDAHRGDRARPRPARLRLALRLGPGRRGARAALPAVHALLAGSGRPDDHHAARRVMGDLVRHAAEQEALRAGHALVADHDQVGVLLLGDVEDRVGRVALARVGLDLDPLLLEVLRRPPRALRSRPRAG